VPPTAVTLCHRPGRVEPGHDGCHGRFWADGLLWVVSFAAHFGVDYLVDPRGPNGGLAGSLTGSA
jgi:hypothetical protein